MARMRGVLCCIYVLLIKLSPSLQSHFQGASATWRPGRIFQNENKTEIIVDYRIVWKRNSNQLNSTWCDDDDIASRGLIGDDDDSYGWECKNGCGTATEIIPSKGAVCTQYNEADDWSLGVGSKNFNVSSNGEFNIEMRGCCWVQSLAYMSGSDGSWVISLQGHARVRSDTGLPNRSPISSSTPVIRFQAGCPNFVDLLMFDEDKDTVSCRVPECLDPSCTFHPYLKLTQQSINKCRLSYNAGGPGDITVAVFIIVEDFLKVSEKEVFVGDELWNESNPLSSIEMQILIRVHTDTNACSSRPTWVNETFPNGLVKMAAVGFKTSIDLSIQSENEVNAISIDGPVGITKSPITVSADDKSLYYSVVTIVPTEEQSGAHMICMNAKDVNGKMSEQRCMVLQVGDGSPCDIDNGGCDDLCVSAGSSYYCECDKECWHLADDRRTCIPKIEVVCLPDRFSLELPTCAVSNPTVTIGYDPSIKDSATFCEMNDNGTYYLSEFTYKECLTQTESDFIEIHYHNKVRMWVDENKKFRGSGDDHIPITRGYYYNMELTCSFNKYANVNATFRPQDREENFVQVPGLGSFQFFFDFYFDENFGAAYSPYEYPITVTVNSDIYFGIRTVGGTGLEVFTEKCVAMTTPTPTPNTISYTMIENGCLEDETLRQYSTANAMEDRFSIKAFRFQDNLNTDNTVNIYIQCSAVLCVVGEETRCQKGCIRTRKRRDGQSEILVDRNKRSIENDQAETPANEANVSESNVLEITVSGPFRIEVERTAGTQLVTVVTPTSTKNGGNSVNSEPKDTEDSKEIVIIASAVGGAFLIILLIIIVALIGYYQLVLKPKHKILPERRKHSDRDSPAPRMAWSGVRGQVNMHQEDKRFTLTPPPLYQTVA